MAWRGEFILTANLLRVPLTPCACFGSWFRVVLPDIGDKPSQQKTLLQRTLTDKSVRWLRTWQTQFGMLTLKVVYQPHPSSAQS